MAMPPLRFYYLFLALGVGACWIWAILRLRSHKDPARKFVSALETALGNFVFACMTAGIAGYSIIPHPNELTSGKSSDSMSNIWRLCSQSALNGGSVAVLWTFLLVADGLFIVTRYQWHEPFSRQKVFSLAPFVSCILFGLSLAYFLFGFYVTFSSKSRDDDNHPFSGVVIWQVMFDLILAILDCMLTVLGYVAYKRTRDSKAVANAGAFYLLALVLFAARNIGNVLWGWQWGAIGTSQPTALLRNLHDSLDTGLFAVTLVVLTVLGIREREGLASPGSQDDDEGYTAVAGDDQELENRGPR